MLRRVLVLGGLIILLAFYATEWLEASPTPALVTLGDHSFHNQLHTFVSDPNITKHAKQLGYDYTSQIDAHSYGLGLIYSLDLNQPWVEYRDGRYYIPEQGMNASKRAEYDQYVCIRDLNATDPAFRYYISWVNPAPTGGDSTALTFFANYQSETAIATTMSYFRANLPWNNIDAGFLDQADTDFTFYTINAQYQFSSKQVAGTVVTCANPNPDYSLSAGFLRYRQRLIDVFHERGLPVSNNAWHVATFGQEIYANTTFDHYYNESAANQSASEFGVVPANIVQLASAWPTDIVQFASAWPIGAGIGNTTFSTVFAVAGLAAIQGSWFGTQGTDYQFLVTCTGPTGSVCAPTPGMNAIQLLRVIPNWDNLVNATDRLWDGAMYRSSQSYADQTIVYSRHPKTGKLFVVFRSGTAVLPLRASETVVSVQCVDDIFIERGDCAGHFAVNGSEVRLTGSGQLNQGYIVEVR